MKRVLSVPRRDLQSAEHLGTTLVTSLNAADVHFELYDLVAVANAFAEQRTGVGNLAHEQSATLGRKPGKIFLLLHLPLIRGGALTAALIVFVDCMKELPTTLILRPFNFETLATQVYQFASDELIEQAALGALSIVLCGLIPVTLMVRTISKSREV